MQSEVSQKQQPQRTLANHKIYEILSLQIIQKILKLTETFGKPSSISPLTQLSHPQYRPRSKLEQYLMTPFTERTAKTIKGIRQYLHGFECFSIPNILSYNLKAQNISSINKIIESQKNDSLQPSNQNKTFTVQIIKRDLEAFLNVFSMYSSVHYYTKGQVIDISGEKRKNVRILINGSVAIYEPTNNTSLVNCSSMHKANRNTLISNHNQLTKKIFLHPPSRQKNLIKHHDSHQNDQESIQKMLSTASNYNLNQTNCQQILKLCQISSVFTPHKKTFQLSTAGQLLTSAKTPSILSQPTNTETAFTSICLSSEVILLELNFALYTQIQWLVNSNEQKLYINCLMKKFFNLGYYDAKKYLRKKQNMIGYAGDRKKQIIQRKQEQFSSLKKRRTDWQKKQILELRQNIVHKKDQSQPEDLSEQSINADPIIGIQQFDQIPSINSIQVTPNVSSSLYFHLPYDRCPYLIVEGQVVIVISKIKQSKVLNEKYSIPRNTYTKHQVLRLYQNDIFGIESIGEEKEFFLRYEARKGSKILRMNKKLFSQHLKDTPKLNQEFQLIKQQRDYILNKIIDKFSKQMQKQMLQRYHENFEVRINAEKYEINTARSSFGDKKQLNFPQQQQISRQGTRITYHRKSKSQQNLYKYSQTPTYQTQTNRLTLPMIQRPQISYSSQSTLYLPIQTEQSKIVRKQKLTQIEFIKNKKTSQLQLEFQKELKTFQKRKFSSKNQKGLTVELLKQFKLVDFKEEIKKINNEKSVKQTFIEMRDPSNGSLVRRRFIPSFTEMEGSKDRKKMEKSITRKIGLLNESQTVNHNEKVVKNRKSKIKFQNEAENQRKQFKRLTKVSKSVPKLENFYSKKADIQFRNLMNKKFLV